MRKAGAYTGRDELVRWTVASVALLGFGAVTPALARRHHGHHGRMMFARAFERSHPSHVRPGSFTPPFSAYAVDGNSGRVLYGQEENALRHPASITKVMTLYLLFEKLESGQLTLDDRLTVSAHAAAQAPTKLGLRPGSTIRIEDAVKAIVTKSANDMAVAVAEQIGGDEPSFAQMMTRKAHALGMSRSTFVNASGLPDDRQLTTAHDLAVLGRAIHDRYPRYFRFFSTPSFRYAGQFMPNHNHLMGQIEGMDGIKTGYTRASGFNLLSSVNRNGHWLISVVLGGKSRLGRDRIMADLIAAQIDHCATVRTAPVITENPALEKIAEREAVATAIPVVGHEGEAAPPVETVDDDAAERGASALRRTPLAAAEEDEGSAAVTEAKDGGKEEDVAPAIVEQTVPSRPERKFNNRAVPIQAVPHTRVMANQVQPPARPAFVPGVPRRAGSDMTTTASIRQRGVNGVTGGTLGASTATPSSLKRVADRKASPVRVASLDQKAGMTATAGNIHDFWVVQVGAPPSMGKANDLIGYARSHSHGVLASAKSFTEKVQKGHETLFRARFAGLDARTAASACKSLKGSGMSCFAFRN